MTGSGYSELSNWDGNQSTRRSRPEPPEDPSERSKVKGNTPTESNHETERSKTQAKETSSASIVTRVNEIHAQNTNKKTANTSSSHTPMAPILILDQINMHIDPPHESGDTNSPIPGTLVKDGPVNPSPISSRDVSTPIEPPSECTVQQPKVDRAEIPKGKPDEGNVHDLALSSGSHHSDADLGRIVFPEVNLVSKPDIDEGSLADAEGESIVDGMEFEVIAYVSTRHPSASHPPSRYRSPLTPFKSSPHSKPSFRPPSHPRYHTIPFVAVPSFPRGLNRRSYLSCPVTRHSTTMSTSSDHQLTLTGDAPSNGSPSESASVWGIASAKRKRADRAKDSGVWKAGKIPDDDTPKPKRAKYRRKSESIAPFSQPSESPRPGEVMVDLRWEQSDFLPPPRSALLQNTRYLAEHLDLSWDTTPNSSGDVGKTTNLDKGKGKAADVEPPTRAHDGSQNGEDVDGEADVDYRLGPAGWIAAEPNQQFRTTPSDPGTSRRSHSSGTMVDEELQVAQYLTAPSISSSQSPRPPATTSDSTTSVEDFHNLFQVEGPDPFSEICDIDYSSKDNGSPPQVYLLPEDPPTPELTYPSLNQEYEPPYLTTHTHMFNHPEEIDSSSLFGDSFIEPWSLTSSSPEVSLPVALGTIDPSLLGGGTRSPSPSLASPPKPLAAKKPAMDFLSSPVQTYQKALSSSKPTTARKPRFGSSSSQDSSSESDSEDDSQQIPFKSNDNMFEPKSRTGTRTRVLPRKVLESETASISTSSRDTFVKREPSQKPKRPPKKRTGRIKFAVAEDEDTTWCHHCRAFNSLEKMRCTTITDSKPCGKRFCVRCVLKRYPHIDFDAFLPTFVCPVCNDECNCSHCCKKRGEDYIPERKGGFREAMGLPPLEVDLDLTPQADPERSPTPTAPAPLKTRLNFVATDSNTQIVNPPVNYWGTVYGLTGEKMGFVLDHSTIASAAPSPPLPRQREKQKRRRLFVGSIQDCWNLGANARIRYQSPGSGKGKAKAADRLYIGTSSAFDGSYVTLESIFQGSDSRSSSLSPPPDDIEIFSPEPEEYPEEYVSPAEKVQVESFSPLTDETIVKAITAALPEATVSWTF